MANERNFPNWIDAYLEFTRVSETPPKVHRWVAVGTIAGALRRRVWINMGHFKWTPNFYIIVVSPPGIVHKSTSVGIGARLLAAVPGVHFGPDSTTWQALVTCLEEAHEEIWLDGYFYPMSCITVASSELGSFMDPTDRQMVDVMVDLWDGKLKEGTWSKVTKTQTNEQIVNPWINLMSCTTPSWLGQHFSKQFLEQGFVSRAVFVYAEHKEQLIAYPMRHRDQAWHDEMEAALVADLKVIAKLGGEYVLSPEAVEYGEWWYHELHRITGAANNDSLPTRIMGQLQRKQTHLHKLAMVLAASRRSELVIGRNDLETANLWLQEFESDATRALSMQETTYEAANAKTIAKALRRADRPLMRQELYRMLWETMTRSEFDEALDAAAQVGLIVLDGTTGRIALNS